MRPDRAKVLAQVGDEVPSMIGAGIARGAVEATAMNDTSRSVSWQVRPEQRARRHLHCFVDSLICPSNRGRSNPRRAAIGDLRVHRGLLQPDPASQHAGDVFPGRVRGRSRRRRPRRPRAPGRTRGRARTNRAQPSVAHSYYDKNNLTPRNRGRSKPPDEGFTPPPRARRSGWSRKGILRRGSKKGSSGARGRPSTAVALRE